MAVLSNDVPPSNPAKQVPWSSTATKNKKKPPVSQNQGLLKSLKEMVVNQRLSSNSASTTFGSDGGASGPAPGAAPGAPASGPAP